MVAGRKFRVARDRSWVVPTDELLPTCNVCGAMRLTADDISRLEQRYASEHIAHQAVAAARTMLVRFTDAVVAYFPRESVAERTTLISSVTHSTRWSTGRSHDEPRASESPRTSVLPRQTSLIEIRARFDSGDSVADQFLPAHPAHPH